MLNYSAIDNLCVFFLNKFDKFQRCLFAEVANFGFLNFFLVTPGK